MTRLFLSLYVFIALRLVVLSVGLEQLFFKHTPDLTPTQQAWLNLVAHKQTQSNVLKPMLEQANIQYKQVRAAELALSSSILQALSKGQLIQGFTATDWVIYVPIENSDIIIINIPENADSPSQWWLFSSLFFILLGILIAIWVYPLWCDLTRLVKATGNVNQDGSFDVPELNTSSPLKGVADALRLLEGKITSLITEQRELTGAVTHEFKTPIARLKFALAKDDGLDAEQVCEARKDIDELDTLIQEMLDYSRLSAHQTELHVEDIPVLALCAQRVAHFQSIIPDGVHLFLLEPSAPSNLSVLTSPLVSQSTPLLSSLIANTDVILTADGYLVARALDNLISNAIRHAKSTVQISVSDDPAFIHIHVDDDGPGIAAEHKTRIFDAFFRPDSSRARDHGGSGLGLAIVKRIQDWHLGTCEVSLSKLQGARFTLSYANHHQSWK